jgi:N-acetylglucosaminyldiphosphoundecaprenol N-acetyl-beta-D-mannosaminyltransferase
MKEIVGAVQDVTISSRELVTILGVRIDRISMEQTMERLREFVRSGKPHFVITADASGIVQAQTDAEYRALYDRADLVTPDSAGVLWAARRQGTPLPGRVSGVDLVDRLCAESADFGLRIYFLGAAPGVAELAAERMRLRYPGCHIVGTRHGYFPAESDSVIAQEVAESKPDILFVAMGIPRQEKFILAHQDLIGAKVSMGVGGSFDVFSGKVRRAPIVLQKLHLEWLWRLLQNPSKISKVKLLPEFVWRVWRAK